MELAHGVTGYLYLLDKKTFVIVNFNYDGNGPGDCTAAGGRSSCTYTIAIVSSPECTAAYLYFYDTTFTEPNRFGGGVKIPLSDG